MRTADDSSPHTAGLSAQRQFERRHSRRQANAKARYGQLGRLVASVTADPMTIEAWQRGAAGELATARELARRLHRRGVIIMHDRRIPGRGRANIDHLAIGPSGITVIDTKSSRGHVQLGTVGVINKREQLLVNGRDRTGYLDALERQTDVVADRLGRHGVDGVDVRGALCFPFIRRGRFHFGRARDGLILVDVPKHVAKLAARPGDLSVEEIAELADLAAEVFPAAVAR
jgi:hypothetical protein